LRSPTSYPFAFFVFAGFFAAGLLAVAAALVRGFRAAALAAGAGAGVGAREAAMAAGAPPRSRMIV
jgi:hypothetical protein